MVVSSLFNALSARSRSRLFPILCILILILLFGAATAYASELELVGKLEKKGGWCPVISGNRAYIGEPGGMRILDISDPAHVKERGKISIATTATISDIVVSGTLGFIGCYDGTITTFDAANPLAPTSTGFSKPIERVNSMDLAGGYLYAGWNHYTQGSGYEARFATFDIHNPSSLTLQSVYPITGEIDHFDVSGGKAYIGNFGKGLLILDVSNPTSPTYVSRFDTPDGAVDVAVRNNIAYVADCWGVEPGEGTGTGSIQIIDVSQPKNPSFIGDRHLAYLWGAARIALEGSSLVVMDFGGMASFGLITLDITTPTSPTFRGYYSCYNSMDFAYGGNRACLYSSTGLEVLDLSDISKPSLKSYYAGPGSSFGHDIAVEGDFAYTLEKERFCVVDVSDPRKPFVRSVIRCPYPSNDALTYKSGMVVQNGYAFTGGFYFGSSIIDVHDPDAAKLNSFSIGGDDIAVSNGYAYIADRNIYVYDVKDPKNPQYKSSYRPDGSAVSVAAQGSLIYAAVYRETAPKYALALIKAVDYTSLSLVQTYPLSGSPFELATKNSLVMVKSAGNALDAFELYFPQAGALALRQLTIPPIAGNYGDVTISAYEPNPQIILDAPHDSAYVVTGEGLVAYDVRNYQNIKVRATHPISGQAIAAQGHLVYVLGSDGLTILRDPDGLTGTRRWTEYE